MARLESGFFVMVRETDAACLRKDLDLTYRADELNRLELQFLGR